jgi:hypothetical protein
MADNEPDDDLVDYDEEEVRLHNIYRMLLQPMQHGHGHFLHVKGSTVPTRFSHSAIFLSPYCVPCTRVLYSYGTVLTCIDSHPSSFLVVSLAGSSRRYGGEALCRGWQGCQEVSYRTEREPASCGCIAGLS